MKPFFIDFARVCVFTLAALCAFAPAPALRAQTETTASLSGIVTAADAPNPIADATITLKLASTGDVFTTRTNTSGRYMFIGLRVDGGYTLTATPPATATTPSGAPAYDPQTIGPFSVELGDDKQIDIIFAPSKNADEIVQLERMVVTTTREQVAPGAGVTISEREIEERPGIEETVNDFATSDPRITMVDLESGEIAAAGQNFRYNSIQIDGIRMDDQFGLEDNGLPTLGNPFSMETVQSISVDLTPYQVTRGGFTGAAINAVSKSGSNDFAGSAYYSYRNEQFRAPNPSATATTKRVRFSDSKYGITLSGPIIKNRLFFIVSWDHSNHTTPPGIGTFVPAAADVARIIAIARDTYGYDAGSLYDPGGKSRATDRYMAKVDWRINARQRLSVRYNGNNGSDPVFPSSTETSLSSRIDQNKRSLSGWSAQLFSQWHDTFQTEISFSQQTVKARREHTNPWPDVHINGVADINDPPDKPTGSLWIGTNALNQENDLTTRNTQGRFVATWLLGKHRVEFGAEQVSSRFENTYLRYAWGRYTFASIDAFEAGTPSTITFQYTNNGEIPTARWGYNVSSAFVQDTWRPIKSLTLTAGLRLDYPTMGDKPRLNPAFEQTFGMRNDGTIDGAYTLGPRLSFGWAPVRQRKIYLRGGAGLFQGRAPGVWLSNAFTNDGMSALQSTDKKPTVKFNPDIHYRPPLDPENLEMAVNLMSPKLRLPAIIRGNIALDMRLPWQKMTASVEWLWSRSYNTLVYRNLNLRRTGTGPDGRPIYGTWTNPAWATNPNAAPALVSNSQLLYNANNGTGYTGTSFADIYLLTNADRSKDNSQASYLTFSIRRPLQNHWSLTLSYTRGHATEISPISNSRAHSNFASRVSIDPNADEPGTSSTEVRDRILAILTFKFALIRKYNTTLQLIYDGHSGRPYSFGFANDANGDRAGNADTSSNSTVLNDLFYVPSGRNDPKIYWATPADQDRFFAYLETNDHLRRYAGQIVPRNSETNPFQHRVAMRLIQQIPLRDKLRAEFVLDISNLPNLLDAELGRVYQYSANMMPVASGYYDPRTNQYRYSFASTPRDPSLRTGTASRWEIQAAVRVKF